MNTDPTSDPTRPTDEDRAVVRWQIGRLPRGMIAVESRCTWGYPVVVSVKPSLPETGEPFPTHFWLTCPALSADVARVEAAGGVRDLGLRIRDDPELLSRLDEDARRHAEERISHLTEEERAVAEDRGVLPILKDTGIGGTRRQGQLKCLHAHYAFHRARGGLVGEILDEEHGPRECTEDDIRCSRRDTDRG
ncbi:MAG: DUF501 domain-containing protein [Planctomycetota bacterium]